MRDMSDHFQPTWRRGLAAGAVAVLAFLIPQEVPLEYYPLNNPSSGLHYLEITCAANTTSGTQVFLNYGAGINQLDSIYWPISATERPYTYTFPLKDAPIHELRFDPLDTEGELTITNFRIHNRRGEEIRRYTRNDFTAVAQIADIPPTTHGWKLITTPAANDPVATVSLPQPIAPEGMNERNFKRVLLSWSYLALMLWIILLAVYFTLLRHRNRRAIAAAMGFLAFLALTFSIVGNRGLIRESVRSARFTPPPPSTERFLELDLRVDLPTPAQLFWDTGSSFNQEESTWSDYEPHAGLQTLRFPLPGSRLHGLRLDPLLSEGRIELSGIRIVDGHRFTRHVLPLDSFDAINEIQPLETADDHVVIRTTPGAQDPILLMKREAVEAINTGF